MAVSLSEPNPTQLHSSSLTSRRGRDWRERLPVLAATDLVLREMHLSDAGSLLTMIGEDEVARFLAPPPETQGAFREFIRWTHIKRAEGTYACFAVVPRGTTTAIGFFQLRALDADFTTAEWGFALGRPYWGTGIFTAGAQQILAFAFQTIGVQRLEARTMAGNVRGNGALRKLGAAQEGVLRQAFARNGERHDTWLWSILEENWQGVRGQRPVRLVPSSHRLLSRVRVRPVSPGLSVS
jgi:[ribosomal protein S5]-alanine N-acetyltransferase